MAHPLPTVSHPTPSHAQAARAQADLAALFDAHAPALLRVVERLSGSGGHVEEIVQDVFLIAHRQLAAVAAAKNPRAWLYAVAINLARAQRRRSQRRRSLWERFGGEPETPDSPEQFAARSEHGATIRACIDRLPEKMREVVVLYELEELEGAAIAALLGIPVNTVWTRLRSGRAKLMKLLMAHGFGPGGET